MSRLGTYSYNTLKYGLINAVLLAALVTIVDIQPVHALQEHERVVIKIGHSEVIEFGETVKRISIANPDIADANVTTPTQVVINGKEQGSTSMIVWNEQEQFTNYELIVHSMDTRNQVMLKVRIAEVNNTALDELGLNFIVKNQEIEDDLVSGGSFAGKVNSPSDPLRIDENVDLFLAIPTRELTSVIKALEEKSLMTTLAKPNLTSINGSEASFLSGGEFPVPIPQNSAGMQTISIVFKEFGIRLKFVPTVLDTSLINIKVMTEVSSLDFENGIEISGFRIPSLITRKTDTTVELNDGEHFVIGGLLTKEVAETISRLPILGQIPVLEKLFSSKRYLNNESELIIMITPSIVKAMPANPVIN